MASEGYNIAGVGVNVDGFSNPSYVTSRDSTYATSGKLELSNSSDSVKGTTFSFSIPLDADIDGMVLRVRGLRSSNPCGLYGYISKDGGSNWFQPATGSTYYALTTSNADYVYGSSTDMWNSTWTPAQVNSNSLYNGRARTTWQGEGDAYGYIDSIELLVYYTLPPPAYGHIINEVPSASIGYVNEISSASISTVNET